VIKGALGLYESEENNKAEKRYRDASPKGMPHSTKNVSKTVLAPLTNNISQYLPQVNDPRT